MKKLVGTLAAAVLFSTSMIPSFGTEVEAEEETNLNIAILMDASGSILDTEHPSDPNLTSRDEARTLVNMIPTNDNIKVSLFQFSNNLDQKSGLTAVDSDNSYSQLGNTISSMTECANATHMVSSITDVCDYLKQNSKDNTRNVLVVFTDGAENGAMTAATATDEKIKETVSNSVGDSGVEVYSLAYDYLDENGNHSVGDSNGYGYRLLEEYANQTGGTVEVAENVNQFRDKFCEILSSLNGNNANLEKVTDGTFETDLEVVEADLSVYTDDVSKITLTKPDGSVVDLNNKDDNIWVQSTKSSVDIKIISPEVGEWKIAVEGKKPEDYNINLLRYYDLSMQINTTVDGKDITSVAPGNRVHLESSLYSAGNLINPKDLYALNNTEAYAYVSDNTSLKNEIKNKNAEEISSYLKKLENVQSFALGVTDSTFTADIPITNAGANLISVFVNSGNFYCYEEVLISGDGSIFALDEPETIYVSNGYSSEISSFSDKYCNSDVDVTMKNDYDTNILQGEFANNTLKLNGLQPGETTLNFTFTTKDGASSFDLAVPVVVSNSEPVTKFDGKTYSVTAGKTITAKDFAKQVSDYENDPITISLSGVSDDSIADASFDNDTLKIKGLSAGKTDVILDVSDGNNIVQATIHVKVERPLVLRILPFIAGLLGLGAIGVIIALLRKKSRRFHNALYEFRAVRNADGNEIISPIALDMQSNLAKVVEQENAHCSDSNFMMLKQLQSILFVGTHKLNQPETITLKKDNCVAMEYMDDYAPAPMEYYFGTSKKAVACSTDGTKRYFRIDIRCDVSSENPDYTITFYVKMDM